MTIIINRYLQGKRGEERRGEGEKTREDTIKMTREGETGFLIAIGPAPREDEAKNQQTDACLVQGSHGFILGDHVTRECHTNHGTHAAIQGRHHGPLKYAMVVRPHQRIDSI